ncbi:MAG: hypothetical protein VYD64_07395 [Pseudomonadota bacterium]|nr:hypothetical protein [Pseudomonadota bacterium]
MEAIEQLKTMRDQAKARIEALPDYKLMTKLTTLIDELEGVFAGTAEGEASASGEASEDEESSEEDSAPASPAYARTPPSAPPSRRFDSGTGKAAAAGAMTTKVAEPAKPAVAEPVSLDPGANSVLAELERLTGDVKDGAAQHDVEHSAGTDPLDEVSDEADLLEEGVEAALEAAISGDDIELDTDSAIMQAMAELEADLGSADIEIEPDPKKRH